jgi:YhcH/YjgK/YiaL family protein
MEKLFVKIIVLIGFLSITGCKSSTDPVNWSSSKIDSWIEKGDWLNGWSVKPDGSVNRKEMATYYYKNRERWDNAFNYLKSTDLSKLEPKRYDIDGNNLYALVSEYVTKNEEDAKFETHQKYIDIQYVISGAEQMSIAPMSMKNEILTPYDATKDVEFMTVTKSSSYNAGPDRFFVFFPSDIHRPSVKIGENSQVKKIVLKLKIE